MKVKAKHVVAFFLISIFLLGITQSFVPVTKGSLVVDQAYWLRLANNAWNYYQPGVSLNPTTGLHSAGLDYPYFTDWDLGVYIQAIIDANQLGILSTSGTWGADARINKIITFLQTRQLTSNGLPYMWYQSTNGNPQGNDAQNAADTGALLVALNNLKDFRPNLAGSINHIVYTRTNYAPLEQAVDALTNSKNLYDYYVANGFAGFWPSRFSNLASSILDNIVSAPTVSTYGATLPTSTLTCEPLLLAVFNLAPNAKLNGLADLVYLAHEARYSTTGKFVAFSEGNTGFNNPSYVYEWVVKEDGSTWTIDNVQDNGAIVPIIYFKAAVGLLAMHNTAFTKNMASYVESKLPTPSRGYSDGIDENGRVDTADIDKTNGMIIGAALYAIGNPPNPTPTPSPSPTPSHTPSPNSSPTPNPNSSPTPNPNSSPTPNPNSSPTPNPTPSPSPPPPGSPTPSPSLNPLTSPTPSPSSSVDPSLTNPPASWLVESITVAVLVAGCVFTLLIIRFRRRKSSKPAVLPQLPERSFRALLFFNPYRHHLFRIQLKMKDRSLFCFSHLFSPRKLLRTS